MLSTVSLAASARAGKFKSSTSHVKESPVAFGGCSVHARESPAGETWVYRSTCCRANSSPRSQQQYHQRLRDARAAADLEFSRLLSGTDLGKRRARSATDAGVLRRKGCGCVHHSALNRVVYCMCFCVSWYLSLKDVLTGI